MVVLTALRPNKFYLNERLKSSKNPSFMECGIDMGQKLGLVKIEFITSHFRDMTLIDDPFIFLLREIFLTLLLRVDC